MLYHHLFGVLIKRLRRHRDVSDKVVLNAMRKCLQRKESDCHMEGIGLRPLVQRWRKTVDKDGECIEKYLRLRECCSEVLGLDVSNCCRQPAAEQKTAPCS